MTMLAEKWQWVGTDERQPENYGKYRVICLQKGQRTEDEYLWNGSYWVTPKGSPSKGVQAWREEISETQLGKALTLADYEARIHLYKEQIGTGYIGIGRTLLEAKEAKVVPHGQWESWVTETTGLTARQAQRCMQAATEIRDGSAMARLEMSKALMLLGSGLEEDQREQIAERAAEEGATVKALREEIRQTKLRLVQEAGATAEIREELKKAEADRVQLEAQMRAREQAYKGQLENAREDAYRRGEMAGGADAAKEIRQLRNDLEGNRRQRQSLQDQLKNAREAAEREAFGLRNELNKQKQYAEELRKRMEQEREAAALTARALNDSRDTVPEAAAKELEALKRNQADLLAAAEEAEKRAADAEAELEALRAGGAGQPEPAWKVLKLAVQRFMVDCEMMPMNPAAMMNNRDRIQANVEWIGGWVDMMRKALDAAVPAEGAVE